MMKVWPKAITYVLVSVINEILLLLQSPDFDVSSSELPDSAASKIVKMDDKLPMTAPRKKLKTYLSL